MQTHETFCDIMFKKEKNKEQNRWKTNNNIMNFNPSISVITLNVKGLNTMIESKNCQTG